MSYTSFVLKSLNVNFSQNVHSIFCFSEQRLEIRSSRCSCTFCFCYVHLELETPNTIGKKCGSTKLLTDRTKKINPSIFCYLHRYANNTYRYFSMVLSVARKNSYIRPNSCTSSPTPHDLKPLPFLKADARSRPPSWYTCSASSVPVSVLKTCHSPTRGHVAPLNSRGKTHGSHTSASYY